MRIEQAEPSLLVLGQVAARDAAGDLERVTGHAGRLLCMLVDAYPAACSRRSLEAALWGEDPPASAASAFRVHLARLRSLLAPTGAAVRARGGGLALEAAPDAVDLLLARSLAERADRLLHEEPDPQEAVADTARALQLFTGTPFAPFEHEPALEEAYDRARQLHKRLEDLSVEALLATGAHDRVLGRLETMVVHEPLDEHRWAQLMVALYRCGRQADALETYQRARRTLIHQVGAEPGPELQRLERAVLTQDPELSATPTWGRRGRRPAGSESVLGQAAVLDEIDELLGSSTVVTVVGVTGSGTSTVVRTYARERSSQEVPIAEPGTLHLLAGVQAPDPDPVQGPMLAVLDLGGPADAAVRATVREVVARGWRLLVAAPSPLEVEGEGVLRIRPLGLEDAVALLVQRTGVDAPTPELVAIAEAVGGHPLSLQLAAGWISTLGEATTARHLADGELSLPDPGDGLVAHVARLRSTLDDRAAAALVHLAAFRHGFELSATQAVTGLRVDDAARVLATLRDSGLLTAEGGGRWRLPAAIRDAVWQLARDDGVDEEALACRQGFLLDVLAPWGLASFGLDGDACVAAIEPWAAELVSFAAEPRVLADPDLVVRLSEGRFWYWEAAGRIPSGDHWFQTVVALVDEAGDHPATPYLLALAAMFGPSVSRVAGRADLVRRAHEAAVDADDVPALRLTTLAMAALALWDGDADRADALLDGLDPDQPDWPFFAVTIDIYRGMAALLRGGVDDARQLLAAAHQRSVELGSPFGEMVILRLLAQVAQLSGDRDHALACFRAAIAAGERCSVGHQPDHPRIGEAELLVAQGDDEGARRSYELAVAGRLAVQDHPAAADCFCGLAEIAARRDSPTEAGPAFRHALLLAWRGRDRLPLVRAAVGLARLALERGDHVEAARKLGAVSGELSTGGRPLTPRVRAARDELLAALPTEDPAVAAALAEGVEGGVEALVAASGVLAAVQPS